MKKEEVDKLADGTTTRTVRMTDGRVLTGAIEIADDGIYNVHPPPSDPSDLPGPMTLLDDIAAKDIASIG